MVPGASRFRLWQYFPATALAVLNGAASALHRSHSVIRFAGFYAGRFLQSGNTVWGAYKETPPVGMFSNRSVVMASKAGSKRELIDTGNDKRFVRRDEKGQFDEVVDVGRSLTQDRQQKAKQEVPAGQGDRGDQKRRNRDGR
jgi:hypothetical protein